MNSSLRAVFAGLALTATLAAGVRTAGAASSIVDRGKLVTYQGDVPIASESFVFTLQGDSIVVASTSERRMRKPDGSQKPVSKTMTLSVRADDFGMLNYTSNESADGRMIMRSIEPGDTVLTVHNETEGEAGGSDVVVRPPGRIFAMDQGMFTLFDVIGRSLQHRIYGSRAVQLVVLGKETRNVEATATAAGPDTVVWGGRTVVTERIALRDSSTAFTLWLSPEGHMLRLESEDGRLVVMREPPALPPPAKRRSTKPRAH